MQQKFLFLAIFFVWHFQITAQGFHNDQFDINPAYYSSYHDVKANYFPFRQGNLWGIADSSGRILIKPCAPVMLNYFEDNSFKYLLMQEDSLGPRFMKFFNQSGHLLQTLPVSNTAEITLFRSGNLLFDNHFILNKNLNIVYQTSNRLTYTGNNWASSYSGIICEDYFRRVKSFLKVYTEELQPVFSDTIKNYSFQVYHNKYWLTVYGLKDTFLLNLLNSKSILYNDGYDYAISFEQVICRQKKDRSSNYKLYNNSFNLIADSLNDFHRISQCYTLIKKRNSYFIIDTLGNTMFPLKYSSVNYANGFFFCYDKQGLQNIVDSSGNQYFSGKYGLWCNTSNFKECLSFKNKFVTLNGKLGIIDRKGNLIALYDSCQSVSPPFYLDTLVILNSVVKKKSSVNANSGFYSNVKRYIISVSNINYTPKNCDFLDFTFNEALGTYFITGFKNKMTGIITINGTQILPFIYPQIRLTNNKKCFIVSVNQKHFLYNIKTRKRSDSCFAFINDRYQNKFFCSLDGRYYNSYLDSNLNLHNLGNNLIKISSIYPVSPEQWLAIGYDSITKKDYIVNSFGNKCCELKLKDVQVFQFIAKENIAGDTNVIYMADIKSFPDYKIYFNSLLKVIGIQYRDSNSIYFNGSEIFIDRANEISPKTIFQFNYKLGKISSLIKYDVISGTVSALFQNKNYDSYEYSYSRKQFLLTENSTVTIINTSGKIILAPVEGKLINFQSPTNVLVVQSTKNDSVRFYFNNQCIFTIQNSIYQIYKDHILIGKKLVSNDSLNFGIIDYSGRILVPFQYSYLYSHNVSWPQDSVTYMARYATTDKYGVIDLKNKTVMPFDYDSLLPEIGYQNVIGLHKNKEVFEFNAYNHKISKLDTTLKNYNIGYRIDKGNDGLLGIKSPVGNLVVPYKYTNIHKEIYFNSFISPLLYYTLKEISLPSGKRIMVKSYFDINGTEFWKD